MIASDPGQARGIQGVSHLSPECFDELRAKPETLIGQRMLDEF
jgi:hypothetical protein